MSSLRPHLWARGVVFVRMWRKGGGKCRRSSADPPFRSSCIVWHFFAGGVKPAAFVKIAIVAVGALELAKHRGRVVLGAAWHLSLFVTVGTLENDVAGFCFHAFSFRG
jgi:hypothetical protein